MNTKEVIEILDDPRAVSPTRLARNTQVKGLLDLAEQLQGILVPVAPDGGFRQQLHGRLVREAQRRQAYQTELSRSGLETKGEASLFRQHRKGILIGAAAVGSVASVMGVIIAFVLHYRHGRAAAIRRAAG
jgi:hypothetical protein